MPDSLRPVFPLLLPILQSAVPEPLGEIGVVRPETAGTYSNTVGLVSLREDPERARACLPADVRALFECEYGGVRGLTAVSKPLSGERPARKREFQIVTGCYLWKAAASLIERHAGFGIVPPTVTREVGGDVGSLQLHIPPGLAEVPSRCRHRTLWGRPWAKSWKSMAALDRLINNGDRRETNFLVGRWAPELVVAIDHGYSFCRTCAGDSDDAYAYFQGHPERAALGADMTACLERLLAGRDAVLAEMPEEIAALTEMDDYDFFGKAGRTLAAKSLVV